MYSGEFSFWSSCRGANLPALVSAVVVVAGAGIVAGQDGPPGFTVRDVRSGYEQNRRAFRSVRITWTRTLERGPGWFENASHQARRLEARLSAGGLPRDDELQIQDEVAGLQSMIAHPLNRQAQHAHQDFWSNGTAFQIRTPADSRALEPTWTPPDAPVLPENLPDDYADLDVYHYTGDIEDGFRIWSGAAQDHAGRIAIALPETAYTHLPPLAPEFAHPYGRLHPFDEFFAAPVESLRVVGPERVDGRRVIVIERAVDQTELVEVMLPPDRAGEYADRIQRFAVTRAWVDPQRGFVPLRMLQHVRWLLDGREIPHYYEYLGSPVIDGVEVERTATGGYYPMRGVVRQYIMPPDAAPVTIMHVIDGGEPVELEFPVSDEVHWQVSNIEPLRAESATLDLTFPVGTVYIDERTSRVMVMGEAGPVVDRILHEHGPLEVMPRDMIFWLAVGNAILLVMIVLVVLVRRRLSR